MKHDDTFKRKKKKKTESIWKEMKRKKCGRGCTQKVITTKKKPKEQKHMQTHTHTKKKKRYNSNEDSTVSNMRASG